MDRRAYHWLKASIWTEPTSRKEGHNMGRSQNGQAITWTEGQNIGRKLRCGRKATALTENHNMGTTPQHGNKITTVTKGHNINIPTAWAESHSIERSQHGQMITDWTEEHNIDWRP